MKILWVSRHPPLKSQILALKARFGEGVEVIQDPNPFSGAEDIASRFKSGGFDDLVVVAPLSVIAHLVQLGLHPIWAEMEQVPESQAEVVTTGRGYRFLRFSRIKRVALQFEEL